MHTRVLISPRSSSVSPWVTCTRHLGSPNPAWPLVLASSVGGSTMQQLAPAKHGVLRSPPTPTSPGTSNAPSWLASPDSSLNPYLFLPPTAAGISNLDCCPAHPSTFCRGGLRDCLHTKAKAQVRTRALGVARLSSLAPASPLPLAPAFPVFQVFQVPALSLLPPAPLGYPIPVTS